MRLLFFCFFYIIAFTGSAQSISGIINHYAAVSAVDTCSGKLTVSDTSGFQKGTVLLIIQMQGADISVENNATFGNITSLGMCGRHERAIVDSVGLNAIYLENRLVYDYFFLGKVQVLNIPQYTNVTISDTLFARKWDGNTGGVVALEISGTLTLNAPIIADACGLRGGQAIPASINNCTWLIGESAYFYDANSWRGVAKGEGIAIVNATRANGRGSQANGGGGGNDHNAGGGGGAQITDGGAGGNNDEPATFGCDGYFPGVGGRGILSSNNRLFLGGGGGAGHTNNLPSGHGGQGGGIVFLKAGQITGSNPRISANGADGNPAVGDGGGGGGGGGCIHIESAINSNVILQADGGRGGNTLNANGNRCFGPGGGGSGGRIITSITAAAMPVGGDPGLITLSTNGCNGSSSGAQKGLSGSVQALFALTEGSIANSVPQIIQHPKLDSICLGDAATFRVLSNPGNWDYQWQINTNGNWLNLLNGANVQGAQQDSLTLLGALATAGTLVRCKVFKAGCYETNSTEASIYVLPLLSASFNYTVNSTTVSFGNQSSNALTYLWDFGDPASGANNFSTQANVQHTFSKQDTFLVRLTAFGRCDTLVVEKQVIVLLAPTADFEVPGVAPGIATGCGMVTFTPINQSSDNTSSYQWTFLGASPSSSTLKEPLITYTSSGTYTIILTVTNAVGSSTKNQVVQVLVIKYPTAAFTFSLIGTTAQFNNSSQNATNYLWDFGDAMTSTLQNPSHSYTQDGVYTVVLTSWNSCDTLTTTQMIEVFVAPTAGFSLPDTIFSCGPATLQPVNQASGTISAYQWSFPGATPATSNVANPNAIYPSSGTYTVFQTVTNAVGSDQFEQSFVLQVQVAPMADFDFSILANGKVKFTNQSQNSQTYTWDFGDASGFNNQANPLHEYSQSGTYIVTLIVSNACGASIYQQSVQILLSATEDLENAPALLLYPNPNTGHFYVDLNHFSRESSLKATLFDVSGRAHWSQTWQNSPERMEVDMGHLATGSYLLRIESEGGARSVLVWVE